MGASIPLPAGLNGKPDADTGAAAAAAAAGVAAAGVALTAGAEAVAAAVAAAGTAGFAVSLMVEGFEMPPVRCAAGGSAPPAGSPD